MPFLRSLFDGKPHDQLRAVALVRWVVAALLLAHPVHALLYTADAEALATLVSARGFPAPLAIAWSALAIQLVAAVALFVPRAATLGALASAAVVGGGLILYAPRWYVVGGLAEDGQPGIELNMLLLACLGAIAWTYRRRAVPAASAGAGMEIVRVASALSLVAHGAPAFVLRDVEGMRAWGESMVARGFPHGVMLVWSIKSVELTAALLRLFRRCVVPACLAQLAYLVPGLWISHAPHWFVVGPDEGGMEFPVLIIACTIACVLAYLPKLQSLGSTGSLSSASTPNTHS